MCSLQGFPELPAEGEISLCEVDGRVHCMSADYADLKTFTNAVAAYPSISITRELLHSGVPREDVRRVFVPVSEHLIKQLVTCWYEQGLVDALRLATSPENEQKSPLISTVAHFLLKAVTAVARIRNLMQPQLQEGGDSLVAAVSQTQDWQHSAVRCLAWHPHCAKLALAAWDDSVRVYSSDSSLTPILKCKRQRSVACMAWRPFSASELAVACGNCVVVWQMDPNSVVTRPSVSCATVVERPGHSPVTSVVWSPQGDLLLTASAADTTMHLWDVDLERSAPLRRVGGGGVTLVAWAPDSCRVFASTTGTVFRVWQTERWVPERWHLMCGRVQAACWSPCGSVLLFTTSEEAVVYSLTFSKMDRMFQGDSCDSTQAALPVIDLTAVEVGDLHRVGGVVVSMAWDPRGRHLALIFQDSGLVAVFRTSLSTVLLVSPCCFIRGTAGEIPNVIAFQPSFKDGALLTIAWSSGRVQYFPFIYTELENPEEFHCASLNRSGLSPVNLSTSFR